MVPFIFIYFFFFSPHGNLVTNFVTACRKVRTATLFKSFFLNQYWHTKPVHLISPHFNYPTHTLNIFPTLPVGIPCCLSRTSGTYTPAAVGPHPCTFNSQFVGALSGHLFNTLFACITQCLITGYDRLVLQEFFVHIAWIHYTTTLVALRLRFPLDISS